MQRRQFLQLSSAALASNLRLLAQAPMPMTTLGKTGLKVSRFCLGGFHMRRNGEDNAVRLIREAIDLGVNFFDSAALYHNGASDETYGKAIEPSLRKKVILMSKAHIYTRDGAMKLLEDTLRRMRTDYLDLWQCHQVANMQEVDQILGPNGALEAFVQAKKQGKVRHIGFTGHRDPAVHVRLAKSFDGWETVQMPINLVDPHYLSFLENVLPLVRSKGMGVLAMKSNAMGGISRNQIATVAECLRFTLSQDVDVVVSGVEDSTMLRENVLTVKTFKPMSKAEISQVLARTRRGKVGPEVENYKRKPDSAGLGVCHNDGELG